MPECRLKFNKDTRINKERWSLCQRTPFGEQTCTLENFKVESFLRRNCIPYNRDPLFAVADTEFVLTNILDLVSVILSLTGRPGVGYPTSPANGFWTPNLYCALTGEIMREPVTAADNYSYEKEHIEKWFAQGNLVSPITWMRFLDQRTRPNQLVSRSLKQAQMPLKNEEEVSRDDNSSSPKMLLKQS